MEIRHLVTFKTIIELGGFTKAADHLGYAQSTITSHVKSLEEEFGQPLFDRIGKKVLLTDTGEKLIPLTEEMLHLYRNIKEVTAKSSEMNGTLTIAASEALLIYRFPLLIAEFKKKYPEVTIKWQHLDPLTYKQKLARGEVDLCFILSNPINDKALFTQQVIEEPMMFVYPNQHKSEDIRKLNKYTTLFTEKGCSYRFLLEDFIKENEIYSNSIEESWSIEAIKQSVICGIGISVLPYITVKSELENKQLKAIHYKKANNMATRLIYHKNKWLSPVSEAFINTLEHHSEYWTNSVNKSDIK